MGKHIDIRVILTDDADEYDLAEQLTYVDSIQCVYELRDGIPYGMPLIIKAQGKNPQPQTGKHSRDESG